MDKDTITLQEVGNDDGNGPVYVVLGGYADAGGTAAQESYQCVATEPAEGGAYGETVLSFPATPDCRGGRICQMGPDDAGEA